MDSPDNGHRAMFIDVPPDAMGVQDDYLDMFASAFSQGLVPEVGDGQYVQPLPTAEQEEPYEPVGVATDIPENPDDQLDLELELQQQLQAESDLNNIEPAPESEDEADLPDGFDDESPDCDDFVAERSHPIFVELPVSTLINPRSTFAKLDEDDNPLPPPPSTPERVAVQDLLRAARAAGKTKNDYIEFELQDFTFYVNYKGYEKEMRPLQLKSAKMRHNIYYFDGTLKLGNKQHYVTGVEVFELPVGNYGASRHSVNGQIWVRSVLNAKEEIYYMLKKPALEYERFYRPFLWIADLGKHVVDYCARMVEKKREVTLSCFKSDFIQWVSKVHGRSKAFQAWKAQHPSDDYRTSVSANLAFIWKEVNGVPEAKRAARHPLFRELMVTDLGEYTRVLVPPGPKITEGSRTVDATIVTPYIKDCFGHMILGKVLRLAGEDAEKEKDMEFKVATKRAKKDTKVNFEVEIEGDSKGETEADTNKVETATESLPTPLQPLPVQVQVSETITIESDVISIVSSDVLPPKTSISPKKENVKPKPKPKPKSQPQPEQTHPANVKYLSKELVEQIKVGDVISTPRDDSSNTDTKWKPMDTDDHRWFGLVQKVHVAKPKSRGLGGHKSFDVIWFYRPEDTPCCAMKYPWHNELFLSNHCTCNEGYPARVKGNEILAVHPIDWFGSPETGKGEFFVRQLYESEQRRWVTLQKEHLTCYHNRPPKPKTPPYKPGDTVLAQLAPWDRFLEPFEVVEYFQDEREVPFLWLRKLLRRQKLDRPDAPANELVYTEDLIQLSVGRLMGKCLVRFFRPDEKIPCPYDRGGTGNMFFITHRLEEDGKCVPLTTFPTSLRQGFNPLGKFDKPKLRGMDLYCGGGNFGRGLEEGGVVEMRWANDIWDKAIHTYMANTPEPEKVKPFLGSVDDLLRLALEGKFSDNVPRPGEVDFIAAGSPCPGFSLLTQDKKVLNQIKNQSLVASFASFVDFYRPKYGVLENVTQIVQNFANRKQDVLSQLFCALVGMGYQAQLILGDAWAHGAPQSRERVFLYFAAPGLPLPNPPLSSHSQYRDKNRNVGTLCNGESYVQRLFTPTAFKFVSAGEATSDLPSIYDSKPDACIPFPDHRTSAGLTMSCRAQYACIPTHPYGQNFMKAWNKGKGVMVDGDREHFPAEGTIRTSGNSKGWCRLNPNTLFPTVCTTCNPSDARLGAGLHWDEDRPYTVQEVKRAQGYLDEEVLVGRMSEQWRLIGNSVSRHMALAIGLKFREAWLGGLHDEMPAGVTVTGMVEGEVRSNGLAVPGLLEVAGTESTRPSKSPVPTAVEGDDYSKSERSRSTTPATAISLLSDDDDDDIEMADVTEVKQVSRKRSSPSGDEEDGRARKLQKVDASMDNLRVPSKKASRQSSRQASTKSSRQSPRQVSRVPPATTNPSNSPILIEESDSESYEEIYDKEGFDGDCNGVNSYPHDDDDEIMDEDEEEDYDNAEPLGPEEYETTTVNGMTVVKL
ncbi:DNA methyltransferase Dim-2 [Sordaria brevicollis]|uniref:DNA (cytosine-5-)-methyltransferase n=1 Tax=Sordaria brevicollis TaxID=83679 RepID=A0AAE0UDX2_SORBR|nr:DNA methyltransferase Dim-2 [Sordaria brevicollis]